MEPSALTSSFRDPAGTVYQRDGLILRQITSAGLNDYKKYKDSGLYAYLREKRLVVSHEEVDLSNRLTTDAALVLAPDHIPFISYPYEWCFSQLKDAALCTLECQLNALEYGMWLKDASAYNVQFVKGKPLHIDTLSFETITDGRPWPAYRQFCEHFLAPLALMSKRDVRLSCLMRDHLDGIPLDLAVSLLPSSCRISPGLAVHLYAHSSAQNRHRNSSLPHRSISMGITKQALKGLADNLRWTVQQLKPATTPTVWGDYTQNTNYSDESAQAKKHLVSQLLDMVPNVKMAWDLGANTGDFGRMASDRADVTVAWDMDHGAVEENYLRVRSDGAADILPLLADITNPSPSIGWALNERRSMMERGPADLTLALALVHHIAIGNNVPLDRIAQLLSTMTEWLLVEFVGPEDSQVQRLLSTRFRSYDLYSEGHFQSAFGQRFEQIAREPIPGTARTLYLLRKNRS